MVTRFSPTVLAFLILQAPLLAADQPDYVFLMIGQSNMAGRAKMLDEDKKPLAGVQLLNADSKWEQAANPLNRFSSLRKDISMQRMGPSAGFGPVSYTHLTLPTILLE